ncbi:ATP-binding cassette domain-containing protein [Streptococcus danieliae]|uniref:ATP-binding cassette domain-containing protein n=1 Tax=Streptococcus danieliae TaxID=747656 RepID=A0A7Z0M7J1_9STRE|nr:ATP-binding cassette domain-containing protein [Streptococcus danieliae]MBF0700169.1 ATP-binding cassette domain-containing protein [Streptococcus danieliae]NYS97345.1 ATP-binding cassette domain-containing protein [Streptococcus danieliae]
MLSIRNWSAYYGQRKVLGPISLTFEPGKIIGLIGQNGSGKTTFFHSLLGLLRVEGEITLNGAPVTQKSLVYLGLSGSFSDRDLKRRMDEIFEENFIYNGKSPIALSHDICCRIGKGLTGREQLGSLSKGMQQKFSLEMLLALDPQILLLDEPFDGLDQIGIETLKQSLKDQSQQGKIVLLTSHTFSELDALLDELYIIKNGDFHSVENKEYLTEPGGIARIYKREMG